MQPYNHSTPVKKMDFETSYNELLNEKNQLLQEIQEYRALEPIFNKNKEKCDEAYKECEKFMQVLLVRYEKVIRSETEEKERSRRRSLESDELKEMITSLSGQVLEKDKEIELLRSTNQVFTYTTYSFLSLLGTGTEDSGTSLFGRNNINSMGTAWMSRPTVSPTDNSPAHFV